MNFPFLIFRAFPDRSGYPLQFFLFVPSQKEFSLLSFTRHADFVTNNRLKVRFKSARLSKTTTNDFLMRHANRATNNRLKAFVNSAPAKRSDSWVKK
ncbi:hypothetical protein EZS27_013025 [termite gut metagenome]|uniref:Uncharacterized protein n=1 Tax=termite gut metagenome TaxID=433724 RepID=A0A5J4RYM2_9ZZZZ